MKARVIRSVTAQLDEEIDLFEGDIVTVTSIIDDTWYRGYRGEKMGIFPSSHVELLSTYDNSYSNAVAPVRQLTHPHEASGVSARQIYNQCVESTISEPDSYVSSRQLFKQCADSSVSSRQLFKQCADSSVSSRQLFKQCADSSGPSRQLFKQCADSTTSELGSSQKISKNVECDSMKNYSQISSDIVPHGITLYPFCAQFDNELNFQEGEIVNLIRHIDKYWMEGEIGGKKGIFPANYVKILLDCKDNLEYKTLEEESNVCETRTISANLYAVVMYNFDAQMVGDLSVKQGEKVWVVELVNNDWCQVQNNAGQVGSVPCVYLSQMQSDLYQMFNEDNDAFDIHETNSATAVSECGYEMSNRVHASSRGSEHREYLSEATDLEAAMSRNLAELSLSVQHRRSYSAVPRPDIAARRDCRSVVMGEASTYKEPLPLAPAADTHLKYAEFPEAEFSDDEVELRRSSDKDIRKLSEHPKRESIDRVPHRPAPPAPVLAQQAGPECVTHVEHSDVASGLTFFEADTDEAQLDAKQEVEVTEDYKVEDERKKNIEQRQNVISELVMTEKEFSRDMKITYETFNLHNPSFLESYGVDVKLLFGNILEIIHLSEDFADQLMLALKGKSEEEQCIGQCFVNMASRMKSVYGEYTVNHDTVLTLLEKYDLDPAIKRVLDKGVETLRYQISCFDMGSILIKPVQRVLKYPLIVNELIKYTSDDHDDKPDLLKAALAMMDVATDINENKRRKDIVAKYLEENPSTISSKISRISLHSVAKKSNRIGALLSSSLGIKTGARDELYDGQENLFYTLDKMVRSFLKNAETFVACLQETFFIKSTIVENIAAMYDEDITVEVEKFCRIVKTITSQSLSEFKRTIDIRVINPLSLLLKCFEGPWKLVQKRYDKLLDYEAYSSRMDKSKDRQGTLNILKNTFTALNDQLLEELPVLITCSCDVFAECVKAFVLARKLLMGKITKQFLALFSEIAETNPLNDESLEQFMVNHSLAWSQLMNSSLIKQPRYDAGLGGVSKSSTSSIRTSIPASSAATSAQSSSQRAYLQSYYPANKLYQVIENYVTKEYLQLTVSVGQLVAVIKKQNPMGDPKVWFVDNGVTQGFVPSFCLMPIQSDATGQLTADEAPNQAKKLSTISQVSVPKQVYDVPSEADNPPSYETVVSEDVDETTGHLYEEVKDDEMFFLLHDLQSTSTHMLQVRKGQVVKVLHKEDCDGNPEWWLVQDRFGNIGYVPANYLSKYDFN